MPLDSAMTLIRAKRGMMQKIAKTLGLAHQTIHRWQRVPIDNVFAVSEITNTPPELLRPDFFRNDPFRNGNMAASLIQPRITVITVQKKRRRRISQRRLVGRQRELGEEQRHGTCEDA